MKTSRIKNVVSVKPHTNNYGTTYYHNLEMENGDKINLGKKKEQQIGWELTYEIIEEGQQEFNKAKAVAPESFKSGGFKSSFKSNDNTQKQEKIDRWAALGRSIEYLKGAEASEEELFEVAEKFLLWANKSEVNKAVQEELSGRKEMDRQDINNNKDSNNDLPF